jgi:transcriptional antiterminator RfaH
MAWYLIRTKYGNEELAQDNLERQGFETYKPLINLERMRKGKLEARIEPAFRSYVFVNFNPETQSAYTINNTIGVTSLVSFGGILASIPNQTIEIIKKTFEHAEHSDGFKSGEVVHITAGPLKGLTAIFQEPDGLKRSHIMLKLLNQKSLITIENKFICR